MNLFDLGWLENIVMNLIPTLDWASFFAFTVLGVSVYAIVSGIWTNLYIRHQRRQSIGNYTPKAAIIAPCRGIEPGFEAHMKMLLQQDHPNYEVHFATLDEQDTTYPVLSRLVKESPVHATLSLGGLSGLRCQKLDNVFAALDQLSDDVEVIAWVDSDALISHDWLRHLIAPLKDDKIGATTGFRWYLPEEGRPLTYLLNLWTSQVMSNLYNPKFINLWGGSMAIRRDRFESLGVRKRWNRALADDCVMNDVVREAGLAVRFVSACVTSSPPYETNRGIIRFAIRQAIIAKVMMNATWIASTIALSLVHFSFSFGFGNIVFSYLNDQPIAWTNWALIAMFPASILQALILANAVKVLAKDRPNNGLRAKYRWSFLAPFAYTFLWLSMTLASVSNNRFEWRNTTYRMRSVYETEV